MGLVPTVYFSSKVKRSQCLPRYLPRSNIRRSEKLEYGLLRCCYPHRDLVRSSLARNRVTRVSPGLIIMVDHVDRVGIVKCWTWEGLGSQARAGQGSQSPTLCPSMGYVVRTYRRKFSCLPEGLRLFSHFCKLWSFEGGRVVLVLILFSP